MAINGPDYVPPPPPDPPSTPEPTPSYTVYDAPLPFTAYTIRRAGIYLSGDSSYPSGGYLPAGTVVTIFDRAGRTWGYYQHYGQTLRLSDLAYGTPPASASYKAPGRSPGF